MIDVCLVLFAALIMAKVAGNASLGLESGCFFRIACDNLYLLF